MLHSLFVVVRLVHFEMGRLEEAKRCANTSIEKLGSLNIQKLKLYQRLLRKIEVEISGKQMDTYY